MIDIIDSRIDDILKILSQTSFFLKQSQVDNDIQKSIKDDGTILTNYDLAADIFIQQNLQKLFGYVDIISEESSDEHNITTLKKESYFILDPIDGTYSYAKGGDFTINLAFSHQGKIEAGFIAIPKSDKIYCSNQQRVFEFDINTQNYKEIVYKKSQIVDSVDISISPLLKECKSDELEIINKKIKNNIKLDIREFSAPATIKYIDIITNKTHIAFAKKGFKYWDIAAVLNMFDILGIQIYNPNDNWKQIATQDIHLFVPDISIVCTHKNNEYIIC